MQDKLLSILPEELRAEAKYLNALALPVIGTYIMGKCLCCTTSAGTNTGTRVHANFRAEHMRWAVHEEPLLRNAPAALIITPYLYFFICRLPECDSSSDHCRPSRANAPGSCGSQ